AGDGHLPDCDIRSVTEDLAVGGFVGFKTAIVGDLLATGGIGGGDLPDIGAALGVLVAEVDPASVVRPTGAGRIAPRAPLARGASGCIHDKQGAAFAGHGIEDNA